MTTVVAFISLALLVIIVLRQAVRGFAAAVSGPEDLLERTRAVDLIAFRNLLNPEDDEYLQTHLPWYALLRIRLARRRAAIAYVHNIAHNAAIFVRLGQATTAKTETSVREASRQLLALAIETRLLAGIVLLQLYLALLVPWWQPSLGAALIAYGRLRAALQSVVLLQRPEMATRISSGI